MSTPDRVLLVVDDRPLADVLREELVDQGRAVDIAHSVAGAARRLRARVPQLVISELRLPDDSGIALARQLEALQPRPALLIIAPSGSSAQALEAGADDLLTMPLDPDHFSPLVARLLEEHRREAGVRHLRASLADEGFHGLRGRSPAMLRLFDQIRRIAAADGPVLVQGESGTGKELVARALHAASRRSRRPFVAVNCAGIPGDLMESEFFGHVEGAFSGARRGRQGLFAAAEGGTILLDEIGEMAPALQAKLLRVLEDGAARPLGSDRERRLDVRVIAATNRALLTCARQGDFREDLYYRLETFALRVPPLRERDGDVASLAGLFLQGIAEGQQRPRLGIDGGALEALEAYEFPGNVRELRNVIEYAAAFCAEETIRVADLPERVSAGASGAQEEAAASLPDALAHALPAGPPEALPTLAAVRRQYVEHVLVRTNGNKRRAAKILGVSRRTLHRWLADEAGD